MCGILGEVPARADGSLFQRALDTLAHRGPDGQGIWQDGQSTTLGHRRLAIIDRSDDALQPMHYAGRFHIVYNGELYNFLEIRNELKAKGHKFHTNSDTEVLVAAFAEWGADCLSRLNGMWAFAIWDSQDRRLFLARDRMGEKPLFYVQCGSHFVFASEQKALLPFLSEVAPAENFRALCSNPYAYEATEETLFKGVSRFPAGHYAWLDSGRLTKTQYWSLQSGSDSVPEHYEDQVSHLRGLLLESCSIRMRADVPIGTGLSGGIDSSAIAAAIAQNGASIQGERTAVDWQNSFVASFPATVMDETRYARQVADHLGIPLTTINIDPNSHVDDLENWAYLFEEVHEVNPIPHIVLYREMRNKGVLVSLDGHGGDELFGGYESSILHALPSALANVGKMSEILDTYSHVHPDNSQFRGMTPVRMAAYLARYQLRSLLRGNSGAMVNMIPRKRDSLNAHLRDLSFSSILPTLLRNYDRYSMISGVEVRSPLLDHRIVEFAFAIGWQSKIRGGYTKAVLRDAIAPWLPAEIVKRRSKIGFAPPIIDWIRGPLRQYLQDEIHSRSFLESNLIEPQKLSARIEQLISGTGPKNLYRAEQVWKEFGIYLWEKAFLQANHSRNHALVSGSDFQAK